MMAPMTTLKWSYPSLLENTSMCMETWMMMAFMKVSLEFVCFFVLFFFFHVSFYRIYSVQYFNLAPFR